MKERSNKPHNRNKELNHLSDFSKGMKPDLSFQVWTHAHKLSLHLKKILSVYKYTLQYFYWMYRQHLKKSDIMFIS